ncbi:MAG: ABC transporter permease [Acidobacteriota bacterium]
MLTDGDLWREIWDALSHNKVRTLLTAFGVFWGIFLLVVMLGAGNGLGNGVRAGFSDSVSNSLFVWTQMTSMPYGGLLPGRRFSMNDADVVAIRAAVTEAAVIAPRLQLGGYRGGNNVVRGTKTGAFSVMGDVPEIRAVVPMEILSGRFLDPIDMAERRKVAVIGTKVKEILFGGDEPVGGNVKINGVYFTVVGTFQGAGRGDDADEDTQRIFVPFTTFQSAFNRGDDVGWLAITSRPDTRASRVEERVLALLRQRHTVHPDDRRAFGHYNVEEEFQKVQGLFLAIATLTWIVGSGTLAAGAIGVSNIMLIIVRERTKEIGIRRAVGATPWVVMSQIVLEAVILTAIAGATGLCISVGLLALVESFLPPGGSPEAMFGAPEVSLGSALRALSVLVVAGIVAGLLPARRAVAVRPVDALRAEI